MNGESIRLWRGAPGGGAGRPFFAVVLAAPSADFPGARCEIAVTLAGAFFFGGIGFGGDFRFTALETLVDALPRLGVATRAFDAAFVGLFCGFTLPFFEAFTVALPTGFFEDFAAIDRTP